MRRVTRGKIVILTFDPLASNFWLLDYLPELGTLDQQQTPAMAAFEAALGPVQRIAVPIPHDCTDGMLCAYWRRPAAYLDIQSREWKRRYSHLLDLESCDFGYHLLVTG